MNKRRLSRYLGAGLTALAVIVASLTLFFLIYKFSALKAALAQLIDILMPFITGGVIAYLLAPLYNVLCRNLDYLFSSRLSVHRSRQLAVGFSVAISILLGLGVVVGLVAMVVPQVITSIMGLINAMPAYLDQVGTWLDGIFQTYGIDMSVQSAFDNFESWLSTDLLPSLQDASQQLGDGMNSILGNVFTGVMAVVQVVTNLLLGFIIAAYVLADKERLAAQAKKLLYAVLGAQRGNEAMERIRYTHRVFGGFILGKLLDSLFVGVACFVGCSLLRLPYALLVSVVMGVTNVIPFFGPVLGAVPCALLILLTAPIKCVYFVIFILILMQFDGNIVEPRIVGNTTGLSAFSVLFAIILFGGLFGFVGMIIGVPLFAVISSVVSELVNGRLRKKEMSMDTEDYVHLDYVDQPGQRYVKRKAPTEK